MDIDCHEFEGVQSHLCVARNGLICKRRSRRSSPICAKHNGLTDNLIVRRTVEESLALRPLVVLGKVVSKAISDISGMHRVALLETLSLSR